MSNHENQDIRVFTEKEIQKRIKQNGGDLDLSHFKKPVRLPETVVVPGSLILPNYGVYLPKNLRVGRNLVLYSKAFSMPETLFIGNDMRVYGNWECVVPEGTWIGGDLGVYNHAKIRQPERIHIGGSLVIQSHSYVQGLNENTDIGGSIILNVLCDIADFPIHKVNGDLHLNYSKVERLPDGLSVKGNLNLSHCLYLTKLPANLQVGGTLYLSNSNVTEVPEDAKIGKTVYDRSGRVSYIAPGCCFPRGINMECSQMEHLPDDVVIRGELKASGSMLRDIPQTLNVRNDIILEDTKQLEALPENYGHSGNLLLKGSSIAQLPKGLTVAQLLDISYTNIRELPEDLCLIAGPLVVHEGQIPEEQLDKHRNLGIRVVVLEDK